MKTIWKYPLENKTEQTVLMPSGSKILTAQMQHDKITLWGIATTDLPKVPRNIEILGTGHPSPEQVREYIGTVQDECEEVWHIFERIS